MHSALSRRLGGRLAQGAQPIYRSGFPKKLAKRLMLSAVALGLLLASSAFSQVLDGTILLPDSLGPLTGISHVALDEDSAHPRMFIGGEDGNVLVMNTLTGQRLARIQTGPVLAVCFCPAHNKLYISLRDANVVRVVDCNTYETITDLQIGRIVSGLLHNPIVDRVYCASTYMPVISCATDSIVDSLHLVGQRIQMALDTRHNWLYVGSTDTLRVADCSADTIIASIPGLQNVRTACFQPTANKVYVAAGWSLAAIDTKTNTIVYNEQYDTLDPQLAIDQSHNRVYYTYWGGIVALDCATDSIVWGRHLPGRAIGLAPDPEHDKLYLLLHAGGNGYPSVLDAATGLILHEFHGSSDSSIYYSAATRRAFLISNGGEVTGFDCDADTIVVATPLTANIADACLDSVDNKLYFSVGRSGVGIVDCAAGKVIGYARAPDRLRYLAHNSRDDKLYCSSDSSIFVLDCRTDSFVRTISIDAWALSMDWLPTLNKLYCLASADTDRLVVVDCVGDTVARQLSYVPAHCSTFVCPELNQLWLVHGGFKVVDCLHDSILNDTWMLANCSVADYDSLSRKAYLASENAMYVVDMETRQPVDSLLLPHSYNRWVFQVSCAAPVSKAYWTTFEGRPGLDPDTATVVDTRRDSIVARFAVPYYSARACADRNGDYVYFSGYHEVAAADARTDSVVSRASHPVNTRFFIPNKATSRFYIVGLTDSVIQVVYDSVIFAGLQARPAETTQPRRFQTLLNRSTPLRSPADATLFDATGRRAAALKDGANDISHLAPGVYFVRAAQAQAQAQAIRKVVVTR
jgi:DNA-binding beta-propeller fold protein YncE